MWSLQETGQLSCRPCPVGHLCLLSVPSVSPYPSDPSPPGDRTKAAPQGLGGLRKAQSTNVHIKENFSAHRLWDASLSPKNTGCWATSGTVRHAELQLPNQEAREASCFTAVRLCLSGLPRSALQVGHCSRRSPQSNVTCLFSSTHFWHVAVKCVVLF